MKWTDRIALAALGVVVASLVTVGTASAYGPGDWWWWFYWA